MIVHSFSELEELHLDGLPVYGSDWCKALSSLLPNLRVMSLSRCFLSGPIDQSLEKLRSLSVIHLDGNNFSSLFPGFVANFLNLTSLQLGSCGLQGTFPRGIFQLPTLQTIDLSKNELLQGSFPKFHKNSAIQSLDLSFTSFSGGLSTSIGNLRNLSRLVLYHCNFTGALPDSLAKLARLVYLDLSSNHFIGPIPSFQMSTKKLNWIDLSHNGLTGEIPTAHWEGLRNLFLINLQSNFLNGSIPLSLFELPSLQILFLSNNQFSGSILEFQTASPSMLNILDLSSNNLEGPFPSSILKLKNLMFLHLSHNKFNGSIKLEAILEGVGGLDLLDLSYNNWLVDSSSKNYTLISSIPLIQQLYIASCNLTTIPFYLRNLSNLWTLDLSHNQIHGEIPSWIWEVGDGNLGFLDLSHNYLVGVQEPYSLPESINFLDQLQGKIPVLPPAMQYVDLSSNDFASSIPVDIISNDSTSHLGFFSLANNSLTGVIPESLCFARTLLVLDLSGNNFSGEIPTCVTQLISETLVILNLRKNNFRGSIQQHAFPGNCSLKTLDLNGNGIQGEVPKFLANFAALELLDLGHNEMVDKFPCFLKNISTLRVLVLRSNKFHGRIECPRANETWTMLQIFNLAHNNFNGKLPGELLKEWKAMMADQHNSQPTTEVLGFTRQSYGPDVAPSIGPDSHINYLDPMTVTSKGLEMELSKVLTIFTYVDLSCNNFHGAIPEEVGLLKALHVLNLSNNAFTNEIPSSIGNLLQLESLDLSGNNLSGLIPPSLASLSFLSFLNLSFNHLVGIIPKGNQIQTFSANSFVGNEGLCGLPLRNCTPEAPLPNATNDSESDYGRKIDWNLLCPEIGFVVGIGIVVGPLMFCRRWRKWHYERVDDMVFRIFPSAVSRKWVLWTTSR
ncbi:LRR domain containing protein [Trema orientale]|uniref:LRR domain containing protein n=1 Tax=Trema orientale TaxID=63057 RepID=A0A2P5F936_TREOI|nr:LRR domain containing protein [Trema orientale]